MMNLEEVIEALRQLQATEGSDLDVRVVVIEGSADSYTEENYSVSNIRRVGGEVRLEHVVTDDDDEDFDEDEGDGQDD